jgi:DNA-binding beta-propeller fold protein YncE
VNSAGEIYVGDYGGRDHRVLRFDERGRFLGQVGTMGAGEGEFKRPSGVGIDREDFVYVADASNHRVQKLTRELKFVAAWGTEGTGSGQLYFPFDLAVGPWPGEGSDKGGGVKGAPPPREAVYVLERGNHRVQVFSTAGRWLTSFGGFGPGPGELNQPWGIAVGPDGTVYVADTYHHRVQRFRVGAVGEPPPTPPPGAPG